MFDNAGVNTRYTTSILHQLSAADCRYTANFCEENVWWLVKSLVSAGIAPERQRVLFFSNALRQVLLLQQAAAPPGQVLAWDYHVVLQVADDQGDWILDLDSRLPFPVPAQMYWTLTFPGQAQLPAMLRAAVRGVSAAAYLRHFHSDRSHMVGQVAPDAFPDYPVIAPAPGVKRITLAEYLDMDRQPADSDDWRPLIEVC